jgi:hypothetical protein
VISCFIVLSSEKGYQGHMQLDIVTGDMVSEHSLRPFGRWIRHTASVPKGFLRYYVLRLLKEQGGRFFEEQTKLGERLRRKLELLAPLPLGGFWFSPHSEKLRKIQGPQRRFIRTLFNLRRTLEENLTDQALEEVGEFLNSTTEKVEELCKKLEKGN